MGIRERISGTRSGGMFGSRDSGRELTYEEWGGAGKGGGRRRYRLAEPLRAFR